MAVESGDPTLHRAMGNGRAYRNEDVRLKGELRGSPINFQDRPPFLPVA